MVLKGVGMRRLATLHARVCTPQLRSCSLTTMADTDRMLQLPPPAIAFALTFVWKVHRKPTTKGFSAYVSISLSWNTWSTCKWKRHKGHGWEGYRWERHDVVPVSSSTFFACWLSSLQTFHLSAWDVPDEQSCKRGGGEGWRVRGEGWGVKECSVQVNSDRRPREVRHSNRSWTQTAYKESFKRYHSLFMMHSELVIHLSTVSGCHGNFTHL